MLAAYPSSAYLVRGSSLRLRVLDERGRPDAEAIRRASMLVGVIDLDDATRAAARTALARYDVLSEERFVAKGAIGFGDMADAGLVREVGGLMVFVEHPKGSTRTGKALDGSTWETPMLCDYGFFPQTVSVDGEEIDAYVGPDSEAPVAYVISQVRNDGTFDEPKVMLGFASELEAVRAYLAHCPGWCFGGVTPIHVSFLAGLMNIEPTTMTQTLKSAAQTATPAVEKRAGKELKIAKRDPPVSRCMGLDDAGDCAAPPDFEFIWADGRGHAWFCQACAKTWLQGEEGSPDREVVRARKLTAGKASKSFGDAPGDRVAVERLDSVIKADVNVGSLDAGGRALPTQVPKLDEIKIEYDVWSTEYKNDLPDSHFFYVETGGQKDESGKTVPRTLRHFPYKDSAGKVDLPHVRSAVDQAPKSNLPASVIEDVQREGRRILDAHSKTEKTARVAKAFEKVKGWWASTSHIGQALPLDEAPPEIARVVSDAPLTETYPNPDDVGGWLGVIEPDDGAWIAFVAMDGRTLLWTEREPDGGVIGMPYYTYRLDLAKTPIADAIMKGFRPIMKFRVQVLGPSTDDFVPVQKDIVGPPQPAKPKRRIVYGIVLEPNPCDGQGDSQGHTYTEDFVRDACHYYSQFRLLNIEHKGAPIDPARARVVEIFIAPVDFTLDTPRGPQAVKKGSWVMGTEILDDELWARVERGDWQAYSIEGFSRSVAIESAHWNTRQMHCVHCSAVWRAAVAKDRPFPTSLDCPRCHKSNPTAPN